MSNGEQGKDGQTGPGTAPVRRKKSEKDHFGRALRSVYDETLREDVPDDFLDLLGKLD